MEYRPIDRLATWITRLFVLVLILSTATAILELGVGARLNSGHESPEAVLSSGLYGVALLVELLGGVVYVSTAIVFIAWFRRAYRNVPSLSGQPLEWNSAWTIWGWIVPILNFYRPFQLMKEIWYGSVERFEPDDDAKFDMVKWWWGAWLVSSVVSRMIFRYGLRSGDEVDSLLVQSRLTAVETALTAIAAILALRVVNEITRRQKTRKDEDFVERVFG